MSLKQITAAVATALAALCVVAPAQAHFANTSTTGKAGGIGLDYSEKNSCMYRAVKPFSPMISGSPAAPRSTQTVYVQSEIFRWNGASWALYHRSSWASRAIEPGGFALVSGQKLNASPGYYFVRQRVQWFVGNTQLGTVTTDFDSGSYLGNYVQQTQAHVGSYCGVN